MSEYRLDTLGILENTDKSSLHQDYLIAYDNILSQYRAEAFRLIEIGVFNGGSLRTWANYFPRASIVGIDINPGCKAHEAERIEVLIGSQDDPGFLREVLAGGDDPFLIVDDGSHRADHILFAFEALFPALRPGGIYIVEDAYMHFGWEEPHHRGCSTQSFKDYFFGLTQTTLQRFLEEGHRSGFRRYAFDWIERITFVRGAIAIHKRNAAQRAGIADEVIAAAAASREPKHLHAAAGVAWRHHKNRDDAEQLARAAVAATPDNFDYNLRLGEILLDQKKFDAAEDVFAKCCQLRPQDPRPYDLRGAARFNARDFEKAVQFLGVAIRLGAVYAQTHRMRAQAFEALGAGKDAVEQMQKAASVAASYQDAKSYVAELERMQAKFPGV